MRNWFALGATVAGVAAVWSGVFYALDTRAQSLDPRELPARSIPVPDTASPQMQKMIAAPINPSWRDLPKTSDEWKKQVDALAVATVRTLPGLREQLHVKSEPITIDGV